MNQALIDEALRMAAQTAADRGVEVDQAASAQAALAVAGDRDGQDEPHEIAGDALELLGKAPSPSTSRRGRRPFCAGERAMRPEVGMTLNSATARRFEEAAERLSARHYQSCA